MALLYYMYICWYKPVIFPVMGPFCFIGFDAANVVRSALRELANKLICLGLWDRVKHRMNANI